MTLVFRGAAVAVLLTLGAGAEGAGVEAATLKPKTAKDFERYAAAVEARTAAELRPDGPFLVVRHQPAPQVKRDLAALARGEVVVARGVPARDTSSEEIEIDGGMINHWRGAVYVPNVTLDVLLDNLREPNLDKHKQADVLKSVVLERNGNSQKVLLRLKRSGIVTVVYDTHYDVQYQRISPTRAASRSISTRIVEIENAGTPQEKARPEGDDHGFMWRLNSYWRYEQMGNGVMVEVESLTLSRNVPFLLGPIAKPIISRIARETLERTLASMRGRFAG